MSVEICQIHSSYFTSGIICEYGIVKAAAPILTYMIGWKMETVKKYCEKKKFTIEYTHQRD